MAGSFILLANYMKSEKTIVKERCIANAISWSGEPIDEISIRNTLAEIYRSRFAIIYTIVGNYGVAKYGISFGGIKFLFSITAMSFAFALLGMVFSWVLAYINYKIKYSEYEV